MAIGLYDQEEDETLDGPAPADSIAGPQTPSDVLPGRIASVRGSIPEERQPAPEEPDNRAAVMDFIKNNSMTAGIGRGINAIAAATGAKVDNSGYDAMEKSGENFANKELDRAAQVKKAIADRRARSDVFAANQAERATDNNRADRALGLQEENNRLNREARAQALEERKNKASDDQFKVAGFGKRLQQAEDVFSNLEKDGYNRADMLSGAQSMLPTGLQGTDSQEQEQAERNFVNAVLRRESGAAIAPSEFASAAKQYFPRSGDSPEVMAQKKANRQQVVASLHAESGPAWEKIPSVATAAVAPKQSQDMIPDANAGSGGNVVVTNGSKTYSIPLKRLPEAMKDGFTVVKKK